MSQSIFIIADAHCGTAVLRSAFLAHIELCTIQVSFLCRSPFLAYCQLMSCFTALCCHSHQNQCWNTEQQKLELRDASEGSREGSQADDSDDYDDDLSEPQSPDSPTAVADSVGLGTEGWGDADIEGGDGGHGGEPGETETPEEEKERIAAYAAAKAEEDAIKEVRIRPAALYLVCLPGGLFLTPEIFFHGSVRIFPCSVAQRLPPRVSRDYAG